MKTLELHGCLVGVNEDGSVIVGMSHGRVDPSDGYILTPDDFKQLADAQQRVVWAAQHWTSLAQVSDALSSLLAVHGQTRLLGVYLNSENSYSVRLDGPLGDVIVCQTTSDVQELFSELNSAPLSEKE